MRKNFNIYSISYFIATGFLIGLYSKIPGTIGSIVAMMFWFFLILFFSLTKYQLMTIIIFCFVIGIFICNYATNYIKIHDHKTIIWDEFVGSWLVVTYLPIINFKWLILGFFLFRLIDIFKPWPISFIDRKIIGGIGIMIDDLAAATITCLLLNYLS